VTEEDVIRTRTEGFNRALTTHDLDALVAVTQIDVAVLARDRGGRDDRRFSADLDGPLGRGLVSTVLG